MDIYERFAPLYDQCVSDVPYDKWVSQIEGIWRKNHINPELVLELGCGTGNMTYRFAKRSYDMTAIDASAGMLAEASVKFPELRGKILFLKQDMREFELYGTVDAIFSVFDCVNYILDRDGLLKLFKGVSNYLNPGGVFIFDVNAEKKYVRISREGPLSRVYENFSYIWENDFDNRLKINECAANFFILNNDVALYEKITEYHYQKAHGHEEIINAALASGLAPADALDADTMKRFGAGSERIYYVLKKDG